MAELDAYAGQNVKLGVTATDGRTDLFLRATIFNGNGSPVPVGAVNLDHKAIGFYRADILLAPGTYFAVYRNFLDAGRTTLDTDRDHDQDSIRVYNLDKPRLGVAYDDLLDRLIVEVTLSRQDEPMPAAELNSAQIDVYDSDDNLIFSVSDLAPDSLGVFRMLKNGPGLVPDRLYYVRVTVDTTAGQVTANKGFHTTE
jgi:hypothetical protein